MAADGRAQTLEPVRRWIDNSRFRMRAVGCAIFVTSSETETEVKRNGATYRRAAPIIDVLGHEAAARGLDRDGTPNRLGRELDELAEALGLEE